MTMGFHLLSFCIILVFIDSISKAERLDLAAYEYIRTFTTPLALGSCPSRIEQLNTSSVQTTCSFSAGNQGQGSYAREEYTRQMSLVTNASHLLDILGICDGRAASYIGILNGGDCIEIEISKMVTFSTKHVTYVYKELFLTKVDTLVKERRETRPADFSNYTDDKYYLNHIGHGGLEIILIQMQFSNSEQAKVAATFPVDSVSLSHNLRLISNVAGKPKKIMVIMLSSLTNQFKDTRKYKGDEGLKEALKLIEALEGRIRLDFRRKNQIAKPIIYGFLPFRETSKAHVGLEEQFTWKAVSLLEIEAHNLYKAGKNLLKPCKSVKKRRDLPTGFRRPLCTNIKRLMKDAKLERSLLHNKRSGWNNLTAEEKMTMANKFSMEISSVQNQINIEITQLKKVMKDLDLKTEF
ncbi:hypothetical protein ACJMK2_018887 [Sinanodonta woodiana]|uniref:Uncharacterized protein n=1 Tax=Sinanodonta woodiana TaxID=1069815 RepID=A0ABD3UIC8_SINWO